MTQPQDESNQTWMESERQPVDQQSGSPDVSEWTIHHAQQKVDQWIKSIGVRYFSPLTNLAQLVEEVGEVARILARTHGEQSGKPGEQLKPLGDELADVLFVVICLANQSNIDLQAALEANLKKKTQRDATRHLNNSKLAP